MEIDGRRYADIDVAMGAEARHTSGDAWQFWSWYNEDHRTWSPLAQLRAKQARRLAHSTTSQSITAYPARRNAPPRVNTLQYPKGPGEIGFMACPGLTGNEPLNQELEALQCWGCATIVSLVEPHEFTMLGVPDFAQSVQSKNMIWLHLPIRDGHAPDMAFESKWRQVAPLLHRQLACGSSVVFHCHNGQGRSALACSRMLIEAGLTSGQAIHTVESTLATAFDSRHQERYLTNHAWGADAELAESALA
ncbi:hypothetical protein R50071_11660 [Halioxenophilus aromaticivorans]